MCVHFAAKTSKNEKENGLQRTFLRIKKVHIVPSHTHYYTEASFKFKIKLLPLLFSFLSLFVLFLSE